ncbi:MAG: MBL fold metallo-hydrolase [Planctomycetes bacterium]|nr:MBL fold metallo-hydrolase [Planctomycetota bacterium]
MLLDTGLGDSLIPNSMRAGVNLNRINKVVLSHGHKDHTGGMRAFLKAKAGTIIEV